MCVCVLVLKRERKREWAEQLHKGWRYSDGWMDRGRDGGEWLCVVEE